MLKQPSSLSILIDMTIRAFVPSVLITSPLPPVSDLEPHSHHQQNPLQHSRHQKNPPSTPSLPPKPRRQTPNPNKTPRRLDTHHRYAKTGNRLQFPSRPYLRQILYRCEECTENAEEVRPSA